MPNVENAITGVPSLERKRDMLAAQANRDYPNLPDWMKTWTVSQAKDWIEANVNDMASAKVVLKSLAEFAILTLRYHRKYEE